MCRVRRSRLPFVVRAKGDAFVYVLTHFSPYARVLSRADMPGAFYHISNKQNKSRPQVCIALLFLLIRVCMSFFAKRIHFSPAAASQNIQHLDKSNVLGTKDMMCQAPYWAATLTLKLITILWSQCNARPQGVS